MNDFLNDLFVMVGKSSIFFRYKGGKGGGKKGGSVAKAPPPAAPTPTPSQVDEAAKMKDQDRRNTPRSDGPINFERK